MGHTKNAIETNARHAERQVQIGEVADALYDAGTLLNPPSLAALKLQDLIMKAAGGAICEDKWHELPLSTIKNQKGMRNAGHPEIVAWMRELRGAVLTYENLRENYTGIYGLLGAGRVEFEDSGVMRFRFDDEFRKLAEESNLYAVLDRQTALQLSSRYAHRLHEIIALKSGREKAHQEFTVDELRARLGVQTGRLERWSHFKAKALDKAIDEINNLSRFRVRYEITGKVRRKVEKVTLFWETVADLEPVAAELKRHSSGRKARQSGDVETVVSASTGTSAFPATGSISYTDWQAVKREAGCNMDDQMIADKFRSWCGQKGIRLDSKNIETVFRNFAAKIGTV